MDDVGNTWITLEKLITLDKWMNSNPRLCIQAVQREVGNGVAGFICIPRPLETRLKPVACLEAPGPPSPTVGTRKRRVAWAGGRGIGIQNSIVSGMAPGRECTVGGRSRRRQGGRHIPWVRMGDPRVKARGPELGGGVAAA